MDIHELINNLYQSKTTNVLDLSDVIFEGFDEITVQDLRQLRFSDMNLSWSDACNFIVEDYCDADIELKLEALEWMDPESSLKFKTIPEDQLLIRANQLEIKVSIIPRDIDLSQFKDMVTYVDKHRLINIPVMVEEWRDDCLTSYCQLANYPTKLIDGNPFWMDLTAMILESDDRTMIDQMINQGVKIKYSSGWTCKAIYNLFNHSELIDECDHEEFFIEMVNLDYQMEYCIKPHLNQFWSGMGFETYTTRINNRRAFDHMKQLGIELSDINRIFELDGDLCEDELVMGYKMTDITDHFDHLNELIELVVKSNDDGNECLYYAIGIIMRLMKRRIIDISPHAGKHRIIDHLLPYQPITHLKSARY